jgi:hypothetical protein
LAIIAVLIFAVMTAPAPQTSQESPNLSSAKQKLQSGLQDQAVKKKENWQTVNVPPNLDGTIYAYDKNSIAAVKSSMVGGRAGAELNAKVIRGDESILGKFVVLTFLCDGSGRFRINHSYPLPVPSLSQEQQMENIGCGVAQCMMMKKENSPLACSY